MGVKNEAGSELGINLAEGFCRFMGSGMVAVTQLDEGGKAQTVCLTIEDLSAILAAEAA